MVDQVNCITHGARTSSFVCQHVAATLLTRRPVGFFWSSSDSQDFPDAWCEECNKRHVRCGLEWEGEALDELKAKLLCSGCYLEARLMCLGK